MLGSLTTAVVALSAELDVTYLNTAAEALFGVSAKLTLGRGLDSLLDPAAEIEALCRRALANGLTYSRREIEVRAQSQTLILDFRVSPQENLGLILEIVNAEGRLRWRQAAEMAAQQEVSRRMIRQLAHEIKNPLGGLRGAAQLLERKLPEADLKEYTGIIIGEADRLAGLVDGLLRPGGGAPSPRSVNIHEITEHVARLLESERPSGVTLQRDYDPSLPPLWVDSNQLIQALLNVAKNALAAVEERGTIVLRTRALTNYTLNGERHRLVISVEVEDNGPGIPSDLQPTIFYPLVTGRTAGTGLGLTIAQDLVAQNGGLVEFESRPGQTVFKLRVPLKTEPTAT